MPSASWSLQQSIFTKLTADATLLALLGAPRVYDDVPQGADLPYLTFGQSTARDWSTGSDDKLEINIQGFRHGAIPSIPIVEIRI